MYVAVAARMRYCFADRCALALQNEYRFSNWITLNPLTDPLGSKGEGSNLLHTIKPNTLTLTGPGLHRTHYNAVP